MDTHHAITIRGVRKSFKDVKALRGINLSIKKGEIFALLGPNGAGKTTLIRILATLLRQDSGRVEIFGYDLAAHAMMIREFIGLTGQFAAIDEHLTGRENLELVGRLYHLPRYETRKRTHDLLKTFGLFESKDRPAKTYSGGMKRRLDLACSLIGWPSILFLDEPTTGLDPHGRRDVWDIIRQLASRGVTVLLTTQYLEEADQLADRIAVMNHGRIIEEDTPQALKSRVGGAMLALHKPTLDDVFLALTGSATSSI